MNTLKYKNFKEMKNVIKNFKEIKNVLIIFFIYKTVYSCLEWQKRISLQRYRTPSGPTKTAQSDLA